MKILLGLGVLLNAINAQQCSSTTPCANNLCCSQWGWCGSTSAYCAPINKCISNCWPTNSGPGTSSAIGSSSSTSKTSSTLVSTSLTTTKASSTSVLTSSSSVLTSSSSVAGTSTTTTTTSTFVQTGGARLTNECGPNKPCANGTCCSQWGWCGTSADYCSLSNFCQSNCWPLSSVASSSTLAVSSSTKVSTSSSVVVSSSTKVTTSSSVVVTTSSTSTSSSSATLVPVNPNDTNENPWYDARGVFSSCMIKNSVAITFDDGPGLVTAAVLDILKANNIKTTFFVIGSNIAGNEALLKRAYDEGHMIASHTWSHPDLTTLSASQMLTEMNKVSDAIFNVIGVRPKYMRPPYGSINDNVIKTITGAGYKMIMWNIDTLDWQISDTGGSATNVYNNFVAGISPYLSNLSVKGFISLEHDQYTVTSGALQNMITYANSKGLVHRRIDECFGSAAYQ